MNNELKKIKNIYGEKMMHLCRELFPSILETPGKLLAILEANIAPTHSFAEDIIENNLQNDFKVWIYSFINKKEKKLVETDKTPFELMDEAGYTLYECKTEEDIQGFKKYYDKSEELCTFNGGRLDRCYVFFAVKKNVNEIKRENYKNPQRQDEYGTSVISIQFSKGNTNDISIKNRYNHAVLNPDSTFSNNLEKIIPGLTYSFRKHYGYDVDPYKTSESDFLTEQLTYVPTIYGTYYRYNLEIDTVYYCENNNIVFNGYANTMYADEKEKYLLIDQFIIDLERKEIRLFGIINDGFKESITSLGEIKNIDIKKENENKIINITYTDGKTITIKVNKYNCIIAYDNKYIKNVETDFLRFNESLKEINIPNIETIGNNFLKNCESITSISLPNVTSIGDNFLENNYNLETIYLPNVEYIGDNFLYCNPTVKEIDLPKVKTIGDSFFKVNSTISTISFPNVTRIGNNFIPYNDALITIDLPNVKYIGSNFLGNNDSITSIDLPKVKIIKSAFLCYNLALKNINLPEVEVIEDEFLYNNQLLSSIDLPKLKIIGDSFLKYNCYITKINLPEVDTIGCDFLSRNRYLTSIDLPNIKLVGNRFLQHNGVIKSINMPQLEIIEAGFLTSNNQLTRIVLPEAKQIGEAFLYSNNSLKEIIIPNVTEIGPNFLHNNKIIENIEVPENVEYDKRQSTIISKLLKKQTSHKK